MKRQFCALVGLLTLAGCAGGSPAPSPTVTITQTVTAPPAAAPSASSDPTTPAAPAALAKGKLLTTADFTVTVLKYDTSVRVGDGSRIQTLQVKACVTSLENYPDGIGFSWGPWTLVDADSGRREPASDRWDHLGAAYPDDSNDLHQPGECVKGVIQFDPSKQRAKYARYSNDDGDVAMWKL